METICRMVSFFIVEEDESFHMLHTKQQGG